MRAFVSYRRSDTGWAARSVDAALCRRLGRSRVFLDSASIGLGEVFGATIEAEVRRSDVVLVLIGPSWDRPPELERLHDERDLVRREIELARECGVWIVPVLVDRPGLPLADDLPEPLRFLPGLQTASVHQARPGDVDAAVDRVVGPTSANGSDTGPTGDDDAGAPDRRVVDRLLRSQLPAAQQRSGNRDRLVDLVLAVLRSDERLVLVVPARLPRRPRGSLTAIVTTTDLVLVDVGEDMRIRGESRLPLVDVDRIEVAPTFPLGADVLVHRAEAAVVPLLGVPRSQARLLADALRRGGGGADAATGCDTPVF